MIHNCVPKKVDKGFQVDLLDSGTICSKVTIQRQGRWLTVHTEEELHSATGVMVLNKAKDRGIAIIN